MTTLIGVSLEEINALQDAADYLYERGNDIILYSNSEDTITRGKFNSIVKRDPVSNTLHAYPITFNPSDDQLKWAGIKEKVDVIITLATKHLTDLGLGYNSIDTTRDEVNVDGELYTIKDKGQINHFSHVFLNVTLGLYKK